MITKRIIPCLDVRNGRVVKGTNFEGIRDVADPVEMARMYNAAGADELVFYDITASFEGRALFTDILTRVASEIFIPLTVGGGINTLEDFDRVLKCGADKVSVNSGALRDPGLIPAAAQKYGDQCVVLSADVKRVNGQFRVFAKGGREDTVSIPFGEGVLTMELEFDEKGLIPAIVQDHYTKEVLTLAYMNAETLVLTIAEGRTVFWSRSRQEIWRKGDTSGNVQHVVSITADCDKDALVVEVVKDGPACHTGAESCFFNEVYVSPELKQFSWQGLYELIQGRRDRPQEGSYTTYLFEKGKEKILKKVGEECTEVIIAGEKEDKAETIYEISDLAYHVLVLMVQAGITVEEITRELEKRHVIDHKVKQERMQ